MKHAAIVPLLALLTTGCATVNAARGGDISQDVAEPSRVAAFRRAQVWQSTNVASMDLKNGPQTARAFALDQEIVCDYVEVKKKSGTSPKFFCSVAPDDVVKIKYGPDNGEVYGEVLGTRLLWALGFGADAMYPVRVTCRGCSADPFRQDGATKSEHRFAAAVAERPMPGREMKIDGKSGWKWTELDLISEADGGAPLAHRDALKLLAVFLQHTDTKEEQQRLVCLDATERDPTACARPFMMITDAGLTFGAASFTNSQESGAANFHGWSRAKVWEDPPRCVGNLDKSFSGTLSDPVISEAGRRFLADLLIQLSDRQLHDLFAAAHIDRRVTRSGSPASVDDWVAAFKRKRDEIVNHHCGGPSESHD
jgi:hypothetical protein